MTDFATLTARIELNAQNYKATFEQIPAMAGDAAQKAKAKIDAIVSAGHDKGGLFGGWLHSAKESGEKVAEAFGETLHEHLSELTSEVPVIGRALGGLSGAGLLAAAGIGAFGLAAEKSIEKAEEFAKEMRGLDAILTATSGKVGISGHEIGEFAEGLKYNIATSGEVILQASKKLAQFDGVSGTTFRRALKDSADLAAVFGGDMSQSAEKLGGALQNLAEGNIEGLRRGFRFLGTAALENIEQLAKTGQVAQAQEALLSSLEKRVGHAADKNGEGLSGALWQASEAVGDFGKRMVEQYGVLTLFTNLASGLANKLKPDDLSTLGGVDAAIKRKQDEIKSLEDRMDAQGGGDAAEKGLLATYEKQLDKLHEKTAELKKQREEEDKSAADAVTAAKAEGDRQRAILAAQEAAKKAAEEAKRREEAAKRNAENEAKAVAEIEAQARFAGEARDAREVDLKVEQLRLQYGVAFTASEEKRVRIAYQAIDAARAAEESQKRAIELQKRAIDDQKKALEDYKSKAQATYDSLADYFYNALSGKSESLSKQIGDALKRQMANAFAQGLTGFDGSKSNKQGLFGFLLGGGRTDLEAARQKALGDNTSGIVENTKAIDDLISALEKQKQALDDRKADIGKVGANALSSGGYSTPVIDDLTKLLGSDKSLLPDMSGSILSAADQPGDAGDVVITAAKKSGFFQSAADEIGKTVDSIFGKKGDTTKLGQVSSKLSETFGSIADTAGKAFGGATFGAVSGSVVGSLGLKTSGLGSEIGGALGSFIPIPRASLVTGAIGGLLGGALKSTKQGGTSISFDGSSFGTGSTFGNDGASQKAATGLAGSIDQQLNQIISALGASFSDVPNVTIGQRHGDYRVNLGGSSLKIKGGATDFNDDSDGAVAYAVQAIIERSTISGISQASINILKSGQDLSAAIQKATDIESIPAQLKAYTDPLGAAIDTINKKFATLKAELDEGSASAQQYADAEALRSKEIEDATKQTLGSLQSFSDSLDAGSSSPLSLRDQETNALAKYNSLAGTIGTTTFDESAFESAAQTLLSVEKSLNGSTEAYFDVFGRVKDDTTRAMSSLSAAASNSAGDPFASRTADATEAAANSAAETAVNSYNTVSAIDDLRSDLASYTAAVANAANAANSYVSGGTGATWLTDGGRYAVV